MLWSIAVSPQPGWFEETFEQAEKVRRLAAIAAGVNECQGTPWSEELDGKKLHGALGGDYDLESRGFAYSYTAAAEDNTSTPQASANVVLCWF